MNYVSLFLLYKYEIFAKALGYILFKWTLFYEYTFIEYNSECMHYYSIVPYLWAYLWK